MSKLSLAETTSEKLQGISFKDGRIIYVTDTKQLYRDTATERVLIGDGVQKSDLNSKLGKTEKAASASIADKVSKDLTFTNGVTGTYNGSAPLEVKIPKTAADVGAATSDHTHLYAGSTTAGGSANSAITLDVVKNVTSDDALKAVTGTKIVDYHEDDADYVVLQVDSGNEAVQYRVNGGIQYRVKDDGSTWSAWATAGSGGDFVKKTGDTMTGNLTLQGSTLNIKYNSGVANAPMIGFYKGDSNGSGIVIGGGGRTIIGGGESAAALATKLGVTETNNCAEEMHITNDGTIQLHTGCQTIDSRHIYTFNTTGVISGVANPSANTDAANKQYVDSKKVSMSVSGTTLVINIPA